MLPLLIKVLIGAGLGAAAVRFSKSFPHISWRRGALCGALLALLLAGIYGSDSAMNESTPNVKHVAENDFDTEVSRATLPVVVEFYATWCGPCKVLTPRIEELASSCRSQVSFLKVDLDESPTLARRFQIEAVPTVLFLKNGKIINRIIGLPTSDELKIGLLLLAKK